MESPPPEYPFIQTTDPKVRLYTCYGGHHYFHLDHGWLQNYSAFDACFPDIDERLDKYKVGFPTFEMYKDELQNHADQGQTIHGARDRLVEGETLERGDYSEYVWKHLVSYACYYRNHVRKVWESEAVVFDLQRRIAGTLDEVSELVDVKGVPDGVVTTVDMKKSRIPLTDDSVWLSAMVRANEYAMTRNAMGRLPECTHAAILRTGTKHRATYELRVWELREDYHHLFEASRLIYTTLRPDPSPTIPEPLPETLSVCEPRGGR